MERTRLTPIHRWDLFQESPLPMLVVHADTGQVVDCNNATTRLFRQSRTSLVLQNFHDLALPDDASDDPHALHTAARTFRGPGGSATRLFMVVSTLGDESHLRALTLIDPAITAEVSPKDPLTGLDTRESLVTALNKALAEPGDRAAIAFIDMDKFKEVNDNGGHLLGDAILRAAAKAIQSVVRDVDSVVRFGGDEFTIVLPGFQSPIAMQAVCERINLAILDATLDAGCQCSASIGVAIVAAGSNSHFEAMQAADRAMYQAKRAGGNRSALEVLL